MSYKKNQENTAEGILFVGGFFMECGVITRLEVQKKDNKRINVYIDDDFAFGISYEAGRELSVGQTIDQKEIDQLVKRDGDEKAFSKACVALGYRPRSEKEIQEKLTEKGFEKEQIDKTIVRLKNAALIDDQAFADMWIDNRNVYRPRSKRMLAYELKQKGVSDEIIQDALQNVDDEQTALELAKGYSRKLSGYDKRTFFQKLGNYLGRKGYSYECARTVSEQVWVERAVDENET